jgi:starch-binding outer membrane protein, SusD/RagB family
MTNKHSTGRLLSVGLVALSLGACNFISPITSDPNAVPEASADQLFTAIQVNTFFQATSGLSRVASMWTQQMAGTDRQFSIIDNYVITESDFDDEFNAVYTGGGLIDLKSAISQAEDGGRMIMAGILKIHEAYQIGMAASFWGDIPFSEAGDPSIADPKLDPQSDVYDAVQALLDDAITDLQANPATDGPGPGDADLNFAGDPAAWTAVANTLKARFYMHWAEVNGNAAYTAAVAAANNGITSADGDWEARFTTSSTENNVWYQFMRDRSGYISAGDFLPPLMVANSDPRLPLYYAKDSGGNYTARSSVLSTAAGGYGAASTALPIATCAENEFIIAEAQYNLGSEPNAITAAQNALACVEDRLGVDLSAESTNIGGLTGAALFDEIMNQKYIAQFLNPDVYNDYKRTCRPAITEKAGGMPGRLYYGQHERQANSNMPNVGIPPNGKYNANDPNPC